MNLVWKLLSSCFFVVFTCFIGATCIAIGTVVIFHREWTEKQLRSIAKVTRAELVVSALEPKKVDALCKRIGKVTDYRLTVILPDGKVIGDSDIDPFSMESQHAHPEIRNANQGKEGKARRYSPTLQKEMIYFSIPMELDSSICAIVCASIDSEQVDDVRNIWIRRVVLLALLVAVWTIIVSIFVSHKFSRFLSVIKQGLQSLTEESIKRRLPFSSIAEIEEINSMMNSILQRLSVQIDTLTRERDERDALFSCMSEGLLVVDQNLQLIDINESASIFFRINKIKVKGAMASKKIKNNEFIEFIETILASDSSMDREVYIQEGKRYLQIHGRKLVEIGRKNFGAVFVMNDVTRLLHLESLRKDFVANVSHELKTPITAIKGFAETLLDGSYHAPSVADKFTRKILRQANRLQCLIEDVLILSNIEHAEDHDNLDFEYNLIERVLEGAVNTCKETLDNTKAKIEIRCESNLKAKVNVPMLEQAIVNLIDNALKYGNTNDVVSVIAIRTKMGCIISVKDKGEGIAPEFQQRLFERFFRIDKGRSSKLGGTGLGLAIVKHVAIAHKGRVTVDSIYGKGSTFSIILP